MVALLVSDREREYTVELLRGHMLDGRLTAEEFEQRVEEACRARYAADLWHALRELPVEAPPAPVPLPVEAPPAGAAHQPANGSATASLVLGILGLSFLVMSLGVFVLVALPMSVVAWSLGREARRSGTPRRRRAVAGEALGVAGTVLGLLVIAGCASVLLL